jgi:hypothetical protein
MAQSVYRTLKSNGASIHLYIAPLEPHGWTELRHERFFKCMDPVVENLSSLQAPSRANHLDV